MSHKPSEYPIQLGVGLPAYGSKLDVGHAAMWVGFGAALASSSERFALRMFAHYHVNGIALCRNTIVYDAIQAGCDWVLMVDADTFHAAKADAIGDAGVDILQMIIDAHRHGAAVVGAPVRGRQIENRQGAVCVQVADGAAWRAPSLAQLSGRLLRIDRIGAAFLAVNLRWLVHHWPEPPWFVMEDCFEGRPRHGRGEDYYFCDGVRARGGMILCDGRFVPSHVDRRRLVGED